ncbi:hypothetical protein PV773_09385 [Mesorhizobium sp. CC13]|uniref:hypothetical protein n=1 Tax=Mesorhizobium sp. CC13 TaxID=3029194 RepID=UPI0032649928
MRSLVLRLLMATAAVSVAGCLPMMKAEEPVVVQPAPVQVKKAPVKKVAAAPAPVQKKVVKKPIVPPTPAANERGDREGSDSGGGWGG